MIGEGYLSDSLRSSFYFSPDSFWLMTSEARPCIGPRAPRRWRGGRRKKFLTLHRPHTWYRPPKPWLCTHTCGSHTRRGPVCTLFGEKSHVSEYALIICMTRTTTLLSQCLLLVLNLYCPGWVYLNVYISVSALTGSIYIFKSMPLPWLGVFKCLIQCHCTDWGHLNI